MTTWTRPAECETSACVELSESPEVVILRSSLHPEREVEFTRAEWDAFIMNTCTVIESRTTARPMRLAFEAIVHGPRTCRYHGDRFDFLGLEADGTPRCESCREPWRNVRALAAIDQWQRDREARGRREPTHV